MEDAFLLKHYAGDVMYRVTDWLKKGRGELRGDLQRILHVSDWSFLSALPGLTTPSDEQPTVGALGAVPTASQPLSVATDSISALQHTLVAGVKKGDKAVPLGVAPLTPRAAQGTGKRSTVGTRFAADLAALVKLLESVSARFIRCVKPNMLKAPAAFDGGAVLRQLRYTGMLECIEILRVGFPVKVSHLEMHRLFRMLYLGGSTRANRPGQALSKATLDEISKMLDQETLAATHKLPKQSAERGVVAWAMGYTKVFMRGYLYAHLLRARDKYRAQAVFRLQKWIQRKNSMRKSAHEQLNYILEVGTIAQIERLIPLCRRAQVGAPLLELAAQVVKDLTMGADLQLQLSEALAAKKVKVLRLAVQNTFDWLKASPSEVALRRLPWARAKEVEATLLKWEAKELKMSLKQATEAASREPTRVSELRDAIDEANCWMNEQATEALMCDEVGRKLWHRGM